MTDSISRYWIAHSDGPKLKDVSTLTDNTTMIRIPFAAADRVSQPFQRSMIVPDALPEIVTRLRTAIEAANLWVLHEIDPQMLLARGGFEIAPARQILFFHPALMARLLAADSSALLEAPLKFALTQVESKQVMIRWLDAVVTFARYGNDELAELGRDLAQTTEQIVAGLRGG